MLTWVSIAAVAVVAFLIWFLRRRFGADSIAGLNEKRRARSRIVSRGEFVDGSRQVPVALALTGTAFFYENADMRDSLDLQWVHEIEYDTRLASGRRTDGGKVLRLRCYGRNFEFVLADEVVERWHTFLPPRRARTPVVTIVPAELAVSLPDAP